MDACETPETTAEVDALLCSSVSISANLRHLPATCPQPQQPQVPVSAVEQPADQSAAQPVSPRVPPGSDSPLPDLLAPAGQRAPPPAAPDEATSPAPAADEALQIGSLAGLGEVPGSSEVNDPGGAASGLGGGAIAGLVVAAIAALFCAAAIAVLLLMRKRKRDSRKDKVGVSDLIQPQLPQPPQLLAASRGPPASPRITAIELVSPPGSPAISTSSALPISDWKAAAAADGTLTRTHASATLTGAHQHTIGPTTYATTYQYQGSTYDGAVDSTGTFIPMHRAMTADETEVEHIPADRVVVTQVSGDGDGDGGGFSVRTRTEWTKAGGSVTVFPPGVATDASPGEILKAQLDWLLAKRGGLLLGYLKCALSPLPISPLVCVRCVYLVPHLPLYASRIKRLCCSDRAPPVRASAPVRSPAHISLPVGCICPLFSTAQPRVDAGVCRPCRACTLRCVVQYACCRWCLSDWWCCRLAPYLGRKIGGQGAVVFAQHNEAAANLYAVKFIFSPKAFEIENRAAHTKVRPLP